MNWAATTYCGHGWSPEGHRNGDNMNDDNMNGNNMNGDNCGQNGDNVILF